MNDRATGMRMIVLGGASALAVTLFLAVLAIARDTLNPLSIWTLAWGALASAAVLHQPHRPAAAALMLTWAALPATVGGFGYLHLPAIALLLLGKRKALRRENI